MAHAPDEAVEVRGPNGLECLFKQKVIICREYLNGVITRGASDPTHKIRIGRPARQTCIHDLANLRANAFTEFFKAIIIKIMHPALADHFGKRAHARENRFDVMLGSSDFSASICLPYSGLIALRT